MYGVCMSVGVSVCCQTQDEEPLSMPIFINVEDVVNRC